jgi:hypothetical protein
MMRIDDAPPRCCRCGLEVDSGAWPELALVEQIEGERIREHVTSWPDYAVIEVRRCACGQEIARKLRCARGSVSSADGNAPR